MSSPDENWYAMSVDNDYRRTTGFAFTADIGHTVMSEVYDMKLPVMDADAVSTEMADGTVPASATALYGVAKVVGSYIDRELSRPALERKFGFPGGVGPHNEFVGNGLVDQYFTIYFAAGVANDIAGTFEQAGILTDEQRAGLDLGDWADMICSSWFSHVMHDLALTSARIYKNFGRQPDEYGQNSFLDSIRTYAESPWTQADLDAVEHAFDVGKTEDRMLVTAAVNPKLRRYLRETMRQAGSVGCPVARRAGMLAAGQALDDSHTKRLIEQGYLEVDDETPSTQRQRYSQPYTPIDHGLDVFAALLNRYDERYGMPYITMGADGTKRLQHCRMPRTGVLQRPQ